MTIFVVEDSSLMRKHLRELVSELPNATIVGEADCSADAITSIDALHPDVVILDIKLKEGSGFDVLNTIKKKSAGPLVIVLTNHVQRPYRETSILKGADFFLEKARDFQKVGDILRERL